MKNWLPILIGVIWIAASLYNKGKKGKPAAGKTSGSSGSARKGTSILEQLLSGQLAQEQEIYNESEEEYVEPTIPSNEFVSDEAAIDEKETEAFLTNELSQFSTEGQHATFENQIIDSKNWAFDAEEEDIKSFDLRKAVVYSAILNAPYVDI